MRTRVPKTCVVCGVSFIGGSNAKYCAACRASKKKEYHTSRSARRIGSTDICTVCGKPYTVASWKQKYCPDCVVKVMAAQSHARAVKRAEEGAPKRIRKRKSATPQNSVETNNIGYTLPPLLQPDGPFELVERYARNWRIWFRARCKWCGRIVDHPDTYFSSPSVKSCGCRKKDPRPQASKAISDALKQIPHVCEMCGKPFTGGAHSKFCPDCRDKHHHEWVRNYARRRAGWTEEEIALGHRINN